MGRFEFTPKAGKKYELQIDSPVGITEPRRPAGGEGRRRGAERAGRRGRRRPADPGDGAQHDGARRCWSALYCRGRLLDSVQLEEGRDRGGAEADRPARAASAA